MSYINYKEAIAELDKAIAYLYDTRRQLNKEWKKSMGIRSNFSMDILESDVRSTCARLRYEEDLLEEVRENI